MEKIAEAFMQSVIYIQLLTVFIISSSRVVVFIYLFISNPVHLPNLKSSI